MRSRTLPLALALTCALSALGSQIASAAKLAPLPQSDYAVRPACSAPLPGQASCLALGLEPRTAAAQARVHRLANRSSPQAPPPKASECAENYPSTCLTPEDLRSAYFPGEQPEAPASEPQTIALVDAYNDLNAEADLGIYDTEFNLPPCTTANGCFQKVGESGSESSLPFPKSKTELDEFASGRPRQQAEAEEAEGWALETATDIEVAHAVCRNCHILLVEASGPEFSEPGLETAENRAVVLHATEISDSWGGKESGIDEEAFNHRGIAIVAAAGDDGYLNWDQYAPPGEASPAYFEGADYPASSPHVISVGGTHLNLSAGDAWESESAWNSEGAGGSGCSTSLLAQTWQRHVADWTEVGCGQHRANADISADADPLTGVNVYDSTLYPFEEKGKKVEAVPNWAPIGGTSVASPIIASMVALAGGAHGVAYPAKTLYSHLGTPSLHDVTTGGNGKCEDNYTACSGSLSSPLDCGPGAWICNTTGGYDGPTGVGTPNGIGAFKVEASIEGSEEGEPKGNPLEGGSEAPGGGSINKGSGPSGNPSTNSVGPGNSPGGTPGKPGSSRSTATKVARISALALTAKARAALRRAGLTLAQLGFSFILNRSVGVRVKLAIQTNTGAHAHWRTLPSSFKFAAVKGLNRRRLRGSGQLAPGVYRLTLTPSGGAARSITIRIR
jgi:hypothetical protein